MFARAEAETDRVSIPNSRALGAHRCDPSAISEVIAAAFRDHSAAIHGTALRSTRDPELAADVTQEAFLRLVVEAQAGRFPDNVGGWLYRTSANLVVSRARRAAVARRLAPRLVRFDGPAEPDAVAVLQEQRHELHVALATLSAADRVALLMAAHGATGQEIARHLGRSHAATRTLLSRARGRLRTAAMEVDARSAPFGSARTRTRTVRRGLSAATETESSGTSPSGCLHLTATSVPELPRPARVWLASARGSSGRRPVADDAQFRRSLAACGPQGGAFMLTT
jgi:RNA polymerase sigma factor (sigma-70 family)